MNMRWEGCVESAVETGMNTNVYVENLKGSHSSANICVGKTIILKAQGVINKKLIISCNVLQLSS
jgi:hypothetical protein